MFQNAELTHSYRLTVPTTIYNRYAPEELVKAIRTEVKMAFAKAFGGYTETTGEGGYVAEDGELITEQVFIIEACYAEENDELVEALALKVKEAMKQESVLVRKDNETYFI